MDQPLSGRTRLTPIQLRWPQLAVVVAGVLLVLVVILVTVLPQSVDLYFERASIRRLESAFGIAVGPLPELRHPVWGVTSIRPNSPGERLGFRVGDFFVWSMRSVCFVLDEGLKGHTATFIVRNAKDHSYREITVTPALMLPKTANQPPRPEESGGCPSCWSDPRIPTILALGKDHAPDAHAKLKAIAGEVQESEGRKVARVILDSWSEKHNTYRSMHPHLVDRFMVALEERQKVLPLAIQAFTIVLEAQVDGQGCSSDVRVLRAAPYPGITDLVLATAKKLRYVPRKDGKDYVPDKIVLTFMQEVS